MENVICVPIRSELICELFLRGGVKSNIAGWIEEVLENYLERTAHDTEWNEAYYAYQEQKWGDAKTNEYGNPEGGFHWTPIFLPNGTEIYMEYRREKHFAIVKHGKIHFEGNTYSPAELARKIANNTSRNAWRDLYIKKQGESRWVLADILRRGGNG